MDEPTLRAGAQALLRRLGPMHAAELATHLAEDTTSEGRHAAIPAPAELWSLLLQEPERDPDVPYDDPATFAAFPLADDRLVDLDHLLDGLTLTHVLSEQERDTAVLDMGADLGALHLCTVDARRLPLHGHDAPARLEGIDRVTGPSGWLPDAPAVAVRIHGGAVEVTGLDEVPDVDEDVAIRLLRTLEAVEELDHLDGGPIEDVTFVVEVLARHPRLFDRPRAPLGDLLAAVDLGVVDRQVVDLDPDGVPIPPLPHHLDDHDQHELLRQHLVTGHSLGDDEVAAVFALLDHLDALSVHVAEQLTAGDPLDLDVEAAVDLPAAATDLATLLASLPGTAVLAEDVVAGDLPTAALLLGVLDRSAKELRGTHVRANGHYLRAQLLELVGDDHADAERELRRAVELAQHPEATFELVRYLADRGQAGAALGMLRRVEGPGVDAWTEVLEPWAVPGPVTAGRNDPCPCGSGRKHKVCCAKHNGWPLQARVPWVWDKLIRFCVLPVCADVVADVAEAAGREPDVSALDDVAIANLALFEGGLVEEMCELRGALLPPDELAMLREWAEVRAGLYEAVEVDPGRGLTVLDLASGDRIALRDRSLSRTLQVGDAGLGWIVEEPDGLAPAGGIVKVADHRRAGLLDLLDGTPSADALAAWYGGLTAPPALTNTEGDPLVLTTLRWEVDDPVAVEAALRDRLGAPDEDSGVEEEDDTATFTILSNDEQWVRGFLTLQGAVLTGSANSAARAAMLTDLVADLIPDARLVDEERLPATDLSFGDEDGPWDEDDGLLDLDTLSSEDRAAVEDQLEEMMTAHEDAWVDTPLPALGGATPREAVDDPTRRPALERLLEEFRAHAKDWDAPGRPMDADRLARLLEL